MPQDTRIALLLLGELIAALRANDPDTFKRWLCGGIQDLGEPAVTELLMDEWMPIKKGQMKPNLSNHYQQAFIRFLKGKTKDFF